MTPSEALAEARALLLDFDGPVCAVFAGIPSATVASQLRDVLMDGGHSSLPDAVMLSEDPFDIFLHAATLGNKEARYVEAAFTAHEVEAIASATPTSGAHSLIQGWHESGRPLAIVSNNSVAAINTYLDLYDLRPAVDFVSARSTDDASRLKPNPHLVKAAATALAIPPKESVLIGDSPTDIEAAHAAGVQAIGFANKPGKRDNLARAGANLIIEELNGLAYAS